MANQYSASVQHRIPIRCPICLVVFWRRRRQHDSALGCSHRCGWAFRRLALQGKRRVLKEIRRRQYAWFLCWLPLVVQERRAEQRRRYTLHNRDRMRSLRYRAPVVCHCKQCCRPFDPKGGTGKGKRYQPVFCSRRCAKRHSRRSQGKRHTARAKRRGLPRDYSITALRLFTRDGWRCQLCGCSTPRRLMGKQHPQAPTQDHIIPLSDPSSPGHVWNNVQCACQACNLRKQAKPLGQLRIF